MSLLSDRRYLPMLVGGGIALVAGLGGALLLTAPHHNEVTGPPPASQTGLVIEAGADESRLEEGKALRCFVNGVFVAELTLAECAKRNGVATDSLDVGVDTSGQLAAAGRAGTVLTPLPPPTPKPATAANPAIPAGVCWRYQDGDWRRLPGDLTLNACVQALFAGRCETPGGATYGRWMQQTVRLVPGKVEVSGDNHSFRTLVEQGAGCAIPQVG